MHTLQSLNRPYPYLCIFYQVEGEYDWCKAGGQQFEIPNGSFWVGWTHQGMESAVPRMPVGLWSVVFDTQDTHVFDELTTGPLLPPMAVEDHKGLKQAYRAVASHAARQQSQRTLHLKAAILEWLAVLLEQVDYAAGKGPASLPRPVEAALAGIYECFGDPSLTLHDLARAAGLSHYHFCRVFRRSMYQSPMTYLREHRIQHARSLLRDTRLRVAEVATACGFDDPLYFSRVFPRINGVSPRAYRNKQ